eukprot:Pgem_evm1s7763
MYTLQTNKTNTPPFCKLHTKTHFKVTVKESEIIPDSRGVFAVAPLQKDSLCGLYYGELLNEKQLNERYPNDIIAPYTVKVGDNLYIDPIRSQGIGAIINHCSSNTYTSSNTKIDIHRPAYQKLENNCTVIPLTIDQYDNFEKKIPFLLDNDKTIFAGVFATSDINTDQELLRDYGSQFTKD